MRRLVALTAALLLVTCGVPAGPAQEFDDLIACLVPPDPATAQDGTLALLVDRADIVVSVTVVKAEHTYRGYKDQVGARKLLLRVTDTLKGAGPGTELTIDDGPCPVLAASEGESFIAFLTTTNTLGPGLRAISGAMRPSATRSLAQLAADVRAIRPLDGEARALFAKYGWTVTANGDASLFPLPPLSDFALAGREILGAQPAIMGSLDRYAAAAQDVGLDMSVGAGKRVELLSFWLERKPPDYAPNMPFGDVLIVERRIVAAWVRIAPWAGPFSLRDRAGALAANGDVQPAYPPANRFPSGVNVARTYRLADATTLAFKSGAGANGDITDRARIRDIAAALDADLATTQAVWDRNGTPTTYYLHFVSDGGVVSLQYESSTGVLLSVPDGFAVAPGPAFASLIATLK